LSERELEVLQLIGAGKSLKEIAAMLSLSVKSVGTYRARVLEKMAMSTNADLIRYVIENNLRYGGGEAAADGSHRLHCACTRAVAPTLPPPSPPHS
jgi:DNA-binding CsgD family transcriptional regulator